MISERTPRIDGLYVWTQLAGEAVIAGRFELVDRVGTFYYANSYVERDNAHPLDPINLPLIGRREFQTRANGGIFGALLDAGPDRWGQRVLSSFAPSRPRSPLEYLLAGNGNGCGRLLFSLSRSAIKRPQLHGQFNDLAVLERAAQSLLKDQAISTDLKQLLLEQSGSMGGARPKASIVIDNQPYLAKFNREDDLFNVARVEMACLSMAHAIGIAVPEHRVAHVTANSTDVLLVRRFDFDKHNHKRHYLSANALMNLVRVQENNPDHGYPGLAHLLRKVGSTGIECSRELFRRMSLRLLLGDTDDHSKNLGFLWSDQHQGLQHAPIFDLLPHPENDLQQAMPVGLQGRARSLENLFSQCAVFGLTRKDAEAVVKRQVSVLQDWRAVMQKSGVSPAEIQYLQPSFALVR